MKNYYNFKAKHPYIYADLKPSNERNIFEQDILNIVPNRDQCGRRILILEVGKKWKINKCSINEICKGCILHMEAAMMEPTTQITGAVIIFNLEGFSLQQAMQVTPSFAKTLVDLLQEAVPLRIKNIHVVNEPYIINMVFKLFKPFLKEKIRSRVSIENKNIKRNRKRIMNRRILNKLFRWRFNINIVLAIFYLQRKLNPDFSITI